MELSVYDVPCPVCAGKIVSTARMRDSTKAPTLCTNGHEFMRSEAFAKYQENLMKKPIRAAARLQAAESPELYMTADLAEDYAAESKRLHEEMEHATPERKKAIKERLAKIHEYKEAHKPVHEETAIPVKAALRLTAALSIQKLKKEVLQAFDSAGIKVESTSSMVLIVHGNQHQVESSLDKLGWHYDQHSKEFEKHGESYVIECIYNTYNSKATRLEFARA